MDYTPPNRASLKSQAAVFIGAILAFSLIFLFNYLGRSVQPSSLAPVGVARNIVSITATPTPAPRSVSSATLSGSGTPSQQSTKERPTATPNLASPTATPSPTTSPTPSATPTATRNLAGCNAAGCGAEAIALPTTEYDRRLLLTFDTPTRRICPECPANEHFSEAELDEFVGADAETLTQLEDIARSQEPYQVAPGIVYLVSDYVHHVVVDLKESGFRLRNIIPPIPDVETRESIRITPSYCLTPESLVVMTGDYHGLVGSNKTETGRPIFFHLGRAALFKLDGEYDIDVIREQTTFERTTISWGGGPIFMWDGDYRYNPEQEWFTPENLAHYEQARWSKMVVAVSDDRRYLFLSTSFDITLKEHALNVKSLGEKWGINVDRAMRFDGTESAYLAIRLGDYMVPILSIEEPLIVNCLAIEQFE